MRQYFFPAVKLTLACIVLFCGMYTLLILGIAQAAPGKGEGQVVTSNGRIVGYVLEGQAFTSDTYFTGRPSVCNYNADASSGSNKGPTNPAYLQIVKDRVDSFLVHNPTIKRGEVPSELVTASGSGLDPDISPEAAAVQADRIAAARKIPAQLVRNLITSHTKRPLLGLMGTETVNVLRLNIDLDHLSSNQ